MVSHMKNHHPDNEVFVSRISPQMSERVKQNNIPAIKYLKDTAQQYLKMACVFCETEKDFVGYYWVDHLRTHTGEYTNECIVCEKTSLSSSHCGTPTIKHPKCNVYRDGLSAYLCIDCNYVQINEENMRYHLRKQHGIATSTDHYQSFTLLPALNSLPIKTNQNDILVTGTELNLILAYFQLKMKLIIRKQFHLFKVQSESRRICVLDDQVIRPANNNSGKAHHFTLLGTRIKLQLSHIDFRISP